jgi:hypothetical protein
MLTAAPPCDKNSYVGTIIPSRREIGRPKIIAILIAADGIIGAIQISLFLLYFTPLRLIVEKMGRSVFGKFNLRKDHLLEFSLLLGGFLAAPIWKTVAFVAVILPM